MNLLLCSSLLLFVATRDDPRPDPSGQDVHAAAVARADASVAEAALKVADDPRRPSYHILPAANWINDPNGPIYYGGYYHMFFQHNPYGDDWGHMHWGHARSPDLIHWQRRPIALGPSIPEGEEHVFSGSSTIGPDGKPMIFYTSIGARPPEQWAAVPLDESLDRWAKHPENPILTEAIHGDTKVHEWRDPFVFRVGDATMMVLGGNLNANAGGEAIVALYRARSEDLTDWEYRGVLFRHPDPEVKNIECPLFFPLDGKWVLIVSQGRPVDWFVGDLDEASMRFTPTARGKLDLGEVYAPNVLLNDPKGRVILWGWVNGYPGGMGWRHCLTLPRVLSIGDDGTLRQSPAPELEALRGDPAELANAGGSYELRVDTGEPVNGAVVVRLPDSEAGKPFEIALEPGKIRVGGREGLRPDSPPSPFRIFADHSVVEVYADDGRTVFTRVVENPPLGQAPLEADIENGDSVAVERWPIGVDLGRRLRKTRSDLPSRPHYNRSSPEAGRPRASSGFDHFGSRRRHGR